MSPPAGQGAHEENGLGFDALLALAENTVARLSDVHLPLEELVRSHEAAGRLVSEAEARFAALAEQAGHRPTQDGGAP